MELLGQEGPIKKTLSRGSKSLQISIEGGIAKATIQKNTGKPKAEGETTFLYQEMGGVLASLADRTDQTIVEKFGTVNPTMKSWMRAKGIQLGYTITEDEEDGRTLKAERVFAPK